MACPTMDRPSASLLAASLALSACSLVPSMSFTKGKDASVVYALGPREGFSSPLNGSLRLACPAFEFKGSQITSSRTLSEIGIAQIRTDGLRHDSRDRMVGGKAEHTMTDALWPPKV